MCWSLLLGRWVPSQLLFDPTRRCNPFGWKLFKFPWDPDPWENYVFSGDPNLEDIRSPQKTSTKKQSCILACMCFFSVDWNHQWVFSSHTLPLKTAQTSLTPHQFERSSQIKTVGSETSETYLPKGPLWCFDLRNQVATSKAQTSSYHPMLPLSTKCILEFNFPQWCGVRNFW